MALLTKASRMASVKAVTPVRARVMSADHFDDLARRHPRISALLTLLLASRLGTLRHDAMAGNIFHGYRIRRTVGLGGMSVVYEAEDPAGRLVALKMMSHRLLYDPVARQHFHREADIVESFDHPNIARLYGRFEAFRTAFLVMELCEGISIQKALSSGGALPEPVVRAILGQASRAIAHAHQAGIVHRDIKPANIMVARDGTVKLIDFGLAGQLDQESLAPAFFGTPHYMAPEQMAGDSVGKSIDLFALGHVAFEMLTGESLFLEEEFMKLREEVIRCDISGRLAALSGSSQELRDVLSGMLRRDPGKRRLDFALVETWAAPVIDDRFTEV
jgi:serine/threonine-protein kinase